MRNYFRRWLLSAVMLLTCALLMQPGTTARTVQASSAHPPVPVGAIQREAASSLIEGIMASVPFTTPTPLPSATPTPGACLTGSWSEVAPYPIAIDGNSSAAVGSYIYSFGGIVSNTVITNAYKYNTATNTWSTIAALPGGRAWASAVSDGIYVYILGGIDQNFSTVGTLWRYDPVSNSYNTSLAPYSIPTYFHGSAYLNGKIYRIAGRGMGTDYHVEVYDIASNTWSMATNYPYAAQRVQAVGYNGYVYAGSGNGSASTYRYDPTTNVWDDAAVPDLPAGRDAAAADFYNGRWIFAGGEVNFVLSSEVDAWIPGSANWITLPAMPAARDYYGRGGVTAGGAFYAVGGAIGSGNPTNDVQRYVEVSCGTTTPTNTPSLTTNTPTPAATNTPITTNTPIATNTPPTNTPMPSDTPGITTNTPLPTNTPGGPTDTPEPATATPTDCPNVFVDISGNVFYSAIHYLNCRSVVNGIDATHYGPAGTSTRAQFAKVVVLGFGLSLYTPGTPDFSDVPASYFAYVYIESGFHAGILSGFDQASCTIHGAIFPCYLPNLAITRAQLTKLVVNAAGYTLVTPGGQTFIDVPPSNVFYLAIETAHAHGVINGYPDNSFRPNNFIRRDEMAQIVFKGITSP